MDKTTKQADASGFSAVELLVLLAMMATLAAFSVPMLTSSMRSMQLASDVQKIATTMTLAKQTAMSQMTHSRLLFDLEDNSWSMERLNRTTGQFVLQDAAHGLSDGVANSGIAFREDSATGPSGYSTDSSASVTFNSRGMPVDGSGNVTQTIIYLSNAEQDFAVSASLAGKVQVWKRLDGAWTAQ